MWQYWKTIPRKENLGSWGYADGETFVAAVAGGMMLEHVGSWLLMTLGAVGMVLVRAPVEAMRIGDAARMMAGELVPSVGSRC